MNWGQIVRGLECQINPLTLFCRSREPVMILGAFSYSTNTFQGLTLGTGNMGGKIEQLVALVELSEVEGR